MNYFKKRYKEEDRKEYLITCNQLVVNYLNHFYVLNLQVKLILLVYYYQYKLVKNFVVVVVVVVVKEEHYYEEEIAMHLMEDRLPLKISEIPLKLDIK